MGSSGDKTRDGATSTGWMLRKPMEGSIPHAELFFCSTATTGWRTYIVLTFLHGEPLNTEP